MRLRVPARQADDAILRAVGDLTWEDLAKEAMLKRAVELDLKLERLQQFVSAGQQDSHAAQALRSRIEDDEWYFQLVVRWCDNMRKGRRPASPSKPKEIS